jgi:hypothetical protein
MNKFVLIIIFLFAGTHFGGAQNTVAVEKKAPDLTFTVKKLTDGSFELKSRLALFEKRKDIPIAGARVDYLIGSDLKIDGNVTDKNGYALAIIKKGTVIPRDKDGVITCTAGFAGNNLYEAANTEVKFIETRISMTFDLVDSVKTAKVEAYKIDGAGMESPLADQILTVSVQRMFSRLPVGDVTLDAEGKGSVEFPSGIPGDSIGNLEVVAFMADNETFGNIELSSQVKWGIPKQKVLVTHRALWTQIAPLWMIVSLTILLIGVWAHYTYVVIQIIIIKLKGRKPIVE